MDYIPIINQLGFPIFIVLSGGIAGYKILMFVLDIFRQHLADMRDIMKCHDATANSYIQSNNEVKNVLAELLSFLRDGK